MDPIKSTKYYFIFAGILLLILLGAIALMLFNLRGSSEPQVLPTPTPIKPAVNPAGITSLPKLKEHPSAIDPTSEQVRASQREINKLIRALPIRKEIRLASGRSVTIVIPDMAFQDATWKLSVTLLGIDYQIPEKDPLYGEMKNSFIETTSEVFSLIRTQGADPAKIIYTWGDQAFMQKRAELWLSGK